MKHFRILIAAAALTLSQQAWADEMASAVTATGVDVQAYLEAGDRLMIAIVPTMDVKLNGQLGIGLKSLDDHGTWQTELPSVLMVDGDYFDGAVLQTVAFNGEGIDLPAALGITFGACLPADGVCILEEAEVTLLREADGTLGLTLAAVTP